MEETGGAAETYPVHHLVVHETDHYGREKLTP